MKERPILFSAPMVQAILEGRKTQTRRTNSLEKVNLNPDAREKAIYTGDGYWDFVMHDGTWHGLVKCPYGQIGDQLWVRETCTFEYKNAEINKKHGSIHYRASCDELTQEMLSVSWTPSIHMPRWASRIQLEITGIRVERLNDCSSSDAIAEGIESSGLVINGISEGAHYRDYIINTNDICEWFTNPIASYESLWRSINGPDSWNANPWVWVIEFKRVEHTK